MNIWFQWNVIKYSHVYFFDYGSYLLSINLLTMKLHKWPYCPSWFSLHRFYKLTFERRWDRCHFLGPRKPTQNRVGARHLLSKAPTAWTIHPKAWHPALLLFPHNFFLFLFLSSFLSLIKALRNKFINKYVSNAKVRLPIHF